MAIALVAFTYLLRFISPHELHAGLKTLPLVPAATALMMLGALYAVIRRRITLGMPLPIIVQWGMLAWVAVSLVVNEGGGAVRLLGSNFVRDVFFITIVALIVDRLSRFKIMLAAILASYVVISMLGLPEVVGPRQCAEWKEGDMANLIFDGRPCGVTNDCFRNQPKVRLIPGIGPRLYRCERRGLFGVAAYVGRMRWVGTFSDSNNLGSSLALALPIAMLWGASMKKKRRFVRWVVLPGISLLLATGVIATGSRGSQIGMLIGAGLAGWRLFGKKVLLIAGVGALALGIVVAVSGGKLGLRSEQTYESSTTVSDRYRADAMATGFRLWKEFPVFGVGFLNFEQHHLIDPHNAFLCSLGETGTIGLLLFAFGMWMTFKAAWVARAQAKKEGREDLYGFFAGPLAGMAGGTVSLTLFLSTWSAMTWLVVVTIGTGVYRAAKSEMPATTLRVTHWDLIGSTLGALLVVGMLYLGLAIYYTTH